MVNQKIHIATNQASCGNFPGGKFRTARAIAYTENMDECAVTGRENSCRHAVREYGAELIVMYDDDFFHFIKNNNSDEGQWTISNVINMQNPHSNIN